MHIRRVSILFLLPLAMSAQALRDVAPLKYWPAPLYWQPTHAEIGIAGKAELFSVNSPQAPPPTAAPATALVFVAMTPCRLVDTRAGFGFTGAFGPPSLAGGATRAFPLQTSTTCSIPTTAQAYSLNITIVPPGQMFYLTIWPLGAAQPNVSTQNDLLGTVIANAAIVPAGNDAGSGSVNVFVSNNTDLIVDINGYYAAPTDLNGNTALGAAALTSNTTGNSNTASGYRALLNNTTGSGNTASGWSALADNTTGGDNVANGVDALSGNTTGNNNVAIGTLALALNTTGSYNVASGTSAMYSNTTGNYNTAVGTSALANNTTASANTAFGFEALLNNTTGSANTANGYNALQFNTTGGANTANGYNALLNNTTGNNNTASGYQALVGNTTGSANTANGYDALQFNTTGSYNTASGQGALGNNTSGLANTASGWVALASNTTGGSNTASGYQALASNTTGGGNAAIGFNALLLNTTGNGNIAIGSSAAVNVAGANSNNIHLSNSGASADSGVVRIGTSGTQTSFYAAGIFGVTVSGGIPVYVLSNGQLGTVSSSIRFKEDVHDMADASSGLLQLRPVTYRYKQPQADGSKPIDYGLIAEEVAEVYPDLVARDSDGAIQTVQYQKLTPMLLNEVQKQHEVLSQQAEAIRQLQAQLAALQSQPSVLVQK